MRWLDWFKRPVRHTPASPARRRRPAALWLERLGDRITPANLTLTNAFLVNSQHVAVTTPDIGERVFIEADWSSTGLLPSDSFTISFTGPRRTRSVGGRPAATCSQPAAPGRTNTRCCSAPRAARR